MEPTSEFTSRTPGRPLPPSLEWSSPRPTLTLLTFRNTSNVFLSEGSTEESEGLNRLLSSRPPKVRKGGREENGRVTRVGQKIWLETKRMRYLNWIYELWKEKKGIELLVVVSCWPAGWRSPPIRRSSHPNDQTVQKQTLRNTATSIGVP